MLVYDTDTFTPKLVSRDLSIGREGYQTAFKRQFCFKRGTKIFYIFHEDFLIVLKTMNHKNKVQNI